MKDTDEEIENIDPQSWGGKLKDKKQDKWYMYSHRAWALSISADLPSRVAWLLTCFLAGFCCSLKGLDVLPIVVKIMVERRWSRLQVGFSKKARERFLRQEKKRNDRRSNLAEIWESVTFVTLLQNSPTILGKFNFLQRPPNTRCWHGIWPAVLKAFPRPFTYVNSLLIVIEGNVHLRKWLNDVTW